jgi:NitT/TauT family transport system substrate-binding protein
VTAGIMFSFRRLVTATAVATGMVAFATANAQTINLGQVGGPVDIVVGYQPYYTQSWSGVVMRDKKFYEKYLPAGSTVKFEIGLQGAIIVNNMLANKQNIGYMGDMPAIVSTTKPNVADVRIVATLGLGWDQCNIFLTKPDAPEFKDAKEGLKWLDGKRVAVPKGSCTDRFAQAVFRKQNITPASYLNQNIEVITSGFRSGRLDAAVIWEPTASRLIEEGLAKRMASGASVAERDGGFLAMRADLIQQRPDVVKAWLNAELDAQLFLADPKNAAEVVRMAAEQTSGFTQKSLWSSLYARYDDAAGGSAIRNELHFALTPAALELIEQATEFLHSAKSIDVPKLRPEALMPQFAQDVLKERGLTAPIGSVKAMPMSEFKGN